jgi:hypothetical protein
MGSWHKALLIGAAIIAATASADAHMGGMGGRSSGGFHGGFHGVHGFHSRSFLLRPNNFRFGFPQARFGRLRFEAAGGGAYSADVAAGDYGDYDESDDYAPEDLHFRVQDSFGPGDIGRPSPPPPQAYDNGPWDSARMDPWHGYEPDSW